MSALRRTLARVASQRGYSLIELVTAMAILSTVLGGVVAAFVHGSTAEAQANRRFQAQLNARLALDKIRADVRCASSITPTGASASITLVVPAGCTGGGGSVTWCTQGAGSRFGLYRVGGATCTGGVLEADFLTAATVFTFTAASGGDLGNLHVDLPVDLDTGSTLELYRLVDDIVPRNDIRA